MSVKTISFPNEQPLAIRFGPDEQDLLAFVRERSSAEVRALLGARSLDDIREAADQTGLSINTYVLEQIAASLDDAAGSESRWNGWPAGSARLLQAVREIVRTSQTPSGLFLDPFAGRANYAAVAGQLGVPALYADASPVFRMIAEARLSAIERPIDARLETAKDVRSFAEALKGAHRAASPDALLRDTATHHFGDLDRFDRSTVRASLELLMEIRSASNMYSRITSGIIDAAVVEALPRSVTQLRLSRLRNLLRRQLFTAADFLEREPPLRERPRLIAHEASELAALPPLGVTVVVTHPPWLNLMNYSSSLACWYLGLRRPSSYCRSRDEALAQIATALPRKDASQVAEAVLEYSERVTQRMSRFVIDYFAMMSTSFAAVEKHFVSATTFALKSTPSYFAPNVDVPTPSVLTRMLLAWEFVQEPHRVEHGDLIVFKRV